MGGQEVQDDDGGLVELDRQPLEPWMIPIAALPFVLIGTGVLLALLGRL